LHWLVSVQGLPTAAALAGLAAPYTGHDTYICGPGPFMAATEEALKNLGTPNERLHIEVFKSLESDPFAAVVIEEDDSDEGPATAIVTLDGERHEVRWPRNAKLLDVLLDKGLDAPFSCREGHCGACAVLKKSGDVEMEINDVLEQSDLDEGLILGCQARPRSDSVEVTYDE
jgi:3-ketosteroid 9alpha-monooxygenase subunit B